jgi:hypothetical protein
MSSKSGARFINWRATRHRYRSVLERVRCVLLLASPSPCCDAFVVLTMARTTWFGIDCAKKRTRPRPRLVSGGRVCTNARQQPTSDY